MVENRPGRVRSGQGRELAAADKKQDASAIVERIVNGHENKRALRDLVCEEEDDQDVNTKSQKDDGDDEFSSASKKCSVPSRFVILF